MDGGLFPEPKKAERQKLGGIKNAGRRAHFVGDSFGCSMETTDDTVPLGNRLEYTLQSIRFADGGTHTVFQARGAAHRSVRVLLGLLHPENKKADLLSK